MLLRRPDREPESRRGRGWRKVRERRRRALRRRHPWQADEALLLRRVVLVRKHRLPRLERRRQVVVPCWGDDAAAADGPRRRRRGRQRAVVRRVGRRARRRPRVGRREVLADAQVEVGVVAVVRVGGVLRRREAQRGASRSRRARRGDALDLGRLGLGRRLVGGRIAVVCERESWVSLGGSAGGGERGEWCTDRGRCAGARPCVAARGPRSPA